MVVLRCEGVDEMVWRIVHVWWWVRRSRNHLFPAIMTNVRESRPSWHRVARVLLLMRRMMSRVVYFLPPSVVFRIVLSVSVWLLFVQIVQHWT